MKGYRFYLEYESHAKKELFQLGTVLAIQPDNSWWAEDDYMVDSVAGIFNHPNSQVASCCSSWAYVHKYCKRISEKRAREIHPALFEYLDYNP